MAGFVDVHAHVVPSGDDGADVDRGGARALPPRLRGRDRDPVRDTARACALGSLSADRRDAIALYVASLAEMRAEVAVLGARPAARLGGVPERGRGERSGRARARRDTRRPDRVPRLLARSRGPDRGRRRGGRAGRGGGARAGARPSRAVPARRCRPGERSTARRARLAALPQRSVAHRRPRRDGGAHGVGAARRRARHVVAASDAHSTSATARPREAYEAVRERRGDEIARPLFDGSALPWV